MNSENDQSQGSQEAEDILAAANTAAKNRWLAIFIQLSRSHRFTKFVEDNYVIQDKIDDEQKTIETLVIEKPTAVGPALSSGQLVSLRTLLTGAGVTHVDDTFNAIMRILGQDYSPILTATEADMRAAVRKK